MLSGIRRLLAFASITTSYANLKTPDDLHQQYYTIFPSGNRNAASHRWATYVLERSEEMTQETFVNLFASFCAVSGSPVYPSPAKRWKMTLPQVAGGQNKTGMMYFCCYPCVCDSYDFIKVDTKTITTLDGPKQYRFVVIGNPCLHSEALTEQWQDPFRGQMTSLQQSAPDVKCDGSYLEKATLSDNGHVILSLFFEDGTPGHATADVGFQDSSQLTGYCQKRAEEGYASGMGQIFRKVAVVTPVGQTYVANPITSTTLRLSQSVSVPKTTASSGASSSTTSASSSIDVSKSTAVNTSTTSSYLVTTSTTTISSSSSAGNADLDVAASTSFLSTGNGSPSPSTTGAINDASKGPTQSSQIDGSTSNGRFTTGNSAMLSCFCAIILGTSLI